MPHGVWGNAAFAEGSPPPGAFWELRGAPSPREGWQGPLCVRTCVQSFNFYLLADLSHRPEGKTQARGLWPSGQWGPEPCPTPPCPVCQGGRGHRAPAAEALASVSGPGRAPGRPFSPLPAVAEPGLMEPGGSFLTPSLDAVCFFGELRFLPQLHTHAAFPDGARHSLLSPLPRLAPAPHLPGPQAPA